MWPGFKIVHHAFWDHFAAGRHLRPGTNTKYLVGYAFLCYASACIPAQDLMESRNIVQYISDACRFSSIVTPSEPSLLRKHSHDERYTEFARWEDKFFEASARMESDGRAVEVYGHLPVCGLPPASKEMSGGPKPVIRERARISVQSCFCRPPARRFPRVCILKAIDNDEQRNIAQELKRMFFHAVRLCLSRV